MNVESHEEYIKYRFQRAEESYEEAVILSANGKWNAVINRLYYTCFYAVIALLLKNGIKTKTHHGTRNQFGNHFIRTEKISKQLGKLYSELFDLREKGDYGELYRFDKDTVNPLIEQVKSFLKEIEKHL